MLKKIVVGVAVVVLSLGIAVPASAQSNVVESQATTLAPGIFCIWFGWC